MQLEEAPWKPSTGKYISKNQLQATPLDIKGQTALQKKIDDQLLLKD
jgi:hypothetical protein